MSDTVTAILLTGGALVGWGASLLGLPGNWLIVILGICCWWWPDPASTLAVGEWALIAMLLFAILGEVLEFFAGALGVKKVGGSTRSTVLAVVGSVVGGLAGFFVGSGVPVIGNVVASLAGSALGAWIGSIAGERSLGQPWEHSLQVGGAAFWGRLFGTLAKAFCGTCVAAIFLAALWF